MGGDQLVAALAGDAFDCEHGDDVRSLDGDIYMGCAAGRDAVRSGADLA
jgi:hypothetical protein